MYAKPVGLLASTILLRVRGRGKKENEEEEEKRLPLVRFSCDELLPLCFKDFCGIRVERHQGGGVGWSRECASSSEHLKFMVASASISFRAV